MPSEAEYVPTFRPSTTVVSSFECRTEETLGCPGEAGALERLSEMSKVGKGKQSERKARQRRSREVLDCVAGERLKMDIPHSLQKYQTIRG